MTIDKGQPLNPKLLNDLIHTKYRAVLDTLKTVIPLGFNSLYNIIGNKTFNVRPKVINPYYTTQSGSDITPLDADKSQANIGAAYLGTPWTYQLGSDFGITNYSTSNIGDSNQPFIHYNPTVKINPASDLVGGIPYIGNSPFIFRNHLLMSNWFEDANIRAYTDPKGENIVVKAQSLSMYCPYIESSIEDGYSGGYGTGIKVSDPIYRFSGTIAGTNLAAGDYLVYALGTGTNGKSINMGSNLYITPTVGGNTQYSYGVTHINQVNNHNDITAPTIYERPLFVVYSNGTAVKVSSQTAWNEADTTYLNTNKSYGKLYQQSTTDNTARLVRTSINDRRMVPAYQYYNLNNSSLIDKVSYQGIVRDVPGAGGNQVNISVSFDTNSKITLSGSIGQCELSNGTSSIWVKNLNVANITYNNGSIVGNSNGYYLWLIANVIDKDVASGSTAANSPTGSILHVQIQALPNATWNNYGFLQGPTKSTAGSERVFKSDSFRCRIGWVPGLSSNAKNYDISTLLIKDGYHNYPTVSRYSTNLQNITIGTGVTNLGQYQRISYSNLWSLPVLINSTSARLSATSTPATSIDLELWNISGTDVTGTNWVSVTTDSIATAANSKPLASTAANIRTNAAFLAGPSTGTSNFILRTATSLSVGTNDNIYYAAQGPDGGSYWNKSYKMALVKGFHLPYSTI